MIARRSPMFCQSCREVSASPSYVGGLTVEVLDRINHSLPFLWFVLVFDVG